MNSSIKTLKTEAVEVFLDNIQPILELIKNSYDAGASKVNITIAEKEQYIKIEDDGDGFNPHKFNSEFSIYDKSSKTKYKNVFFGKLNEFRTSTGSKGNGIFSTLRLGNTLEIHSKNKKGKRLDKKINWKKYLEMEVLPNLTKVNFINVKEQYLLSESEISGTVILISNPPGQRTNYKELFLDIKKKLNYVSFNKNFQLNVQFIPSEIMSIQLTVFNNEELVDEKNSFKNYKNINEIFELLFKNKLFTYLIEGEYNCEDQQLKLNYFYNKSNKLTNENKLLSLEKPKVIQFSSNLIPNLELLKTNVQFKLLNLKNDLESKEKVQDLKIDKLVYQSNIKSDGKEDLFNPYNVFYLNDVQMLLDLSQNEFNISLNDVKIRNDNTFSYLALNFKGDMILDCDKSRTKLIDTDDNKDSVLKVLKNFKTKTLSIIKTDLKDLITKNLSKDEETINKVIKVAKKRKTNLTIVKWAKPKRQLGKVSNKIEKNIQNKYCEGLKTLIGEIMLLLDNNNSRSLYTSFRLLLHASIRMFGDYCFLYFFEEYSRLNNLNTEDWLPFCKNLKKWNLKNNLKFELATFNELIWSIEKIIKLKDKNFDEIIKSYNFQKNKERDREIIYKFNEYFKAKKLSNIWTQKTLQICKNFKNICDIEYNFSNKNSVEKLQSDAKKISSVIHGSNLMDNILYENELISIINIFTELILSIKYTFPFSF